MPPLHFNKRKTSKTEKSTFIRSIRVVRTQSKPLFPRLEREAGRVSLQQQRRRSRNWLTDRESWTAIDKLPDSQRGQIWGLKTLGGPSHIVKHHEINLQEFDLVPTVNTRENPLGLLAAGGEKELFWNTSKHSILNTSCPQGKLVTQSLIC